MQCISHKEGWCFHIIDKAILISGLSTFVWSPPVFLVILSEWF